LISRFPNHELIPAALSGQAWAFLAGGKRRQALEAFQALATSHPDTRFGAEALYRAAVILREDGRTEESERTVAELIKRHPTGRFAESALLERALALRDKGELDAALDQLDATEKAFPAGDALPEVLRERALIYYTRKERAAERAAWQRLVDKFPTSSVAFDGYWGLAALAQEDGDYELAVRHYTKAIEMSGGRAEAAGASLQLAGLLVRLGKTSDARKAYLRILSEYPNAPEAAEATVRAGELALQEGDTAKAVELLMRAENVQAAIVPLARALGKAGRGAEAHELLVKRLGTLADGDAGKRTLLLELAKIEIANGTGADAERRLRAVIGESDDELAAEAQYVLADSLCARGELEKADRAFYELLLLYPFEKYHAEARFRIGEINERLKDYPRAREFYREVVREHSTSPYAPRARKRLEVIGP
jgi:TolA-binding protein